jgi:hypothetical protein
VCLYMCACRVQGKSVRQCGSAGICLCRRACFYVGMCCVWVYIFFARAPCTVCCVRSDVCICIRACVFHC